MRRRVALRALGVGALVLAGVVAVGGAGSAEPVVQTGWWYQDVPLTGASTASGAVAARGTGGATPARVSGTAAHPGQEPPLGTLPPPPVPVPTLPPDVTIPDPDGDVPTPSPAPEGGLFVAADPSGVRAMAAVRFAAPSDAGTATLRLVLTSGSLALVPIQACPALSDWLPGPDQPWSARPAHDCDRFAISGTLGSDGTTMSWELPDGFRPADAAVYDVLLVPTAGDGTPYEVAFERPSSTALTITGQHELPVEPPPPPLPDDVPPAIDGFSPDGFTLPEDDLVLSGGPGTIDGTPAAQTGDDGPVQRIQRALENPTTRRIATAALLLLGGYSFWASNRSAARGPRLLGALGGGPGGVILPSVAATTPRGIGRFRRARNGPPTRF